MKKISINELVNEVISDLPREILIYIAKNIKVDTLEKNEIIEYFKNEVSHYSAKVQKKSYKLYRDIVAYKSWKISNRYGLFW